VSDRSPSPHPISNPSPNQHHPTIMPYSFPTRNDAGIYGADFDVVTYLCLAGSSREPGSYEVRHDGNDQSWLVNVNFGHIKFGH